MYWVNNQELGNIGYGMISCLARRSSNMSFTLFVESIDMKSTEDDDVICAKILD